MTPTKTAIARSKITVTTDTVIKTAASDFGILLSIENPDDYGIDILAAGYEVERRTIKSPYWPYPTVHVPYRKDKFFKNKCIIHPYYGVCPCQGLLFSRKPYFSRS